MYYKKIAVYYKDLLKIQPAYAPEILPLAR